MTGADRLRGRVPLAISAVPLLAALALTYRDGGYFIDAWGVAAIVLLGVLATAVLMWRSPLGGPAGMVALAGWCGLAAWQGLSSLWADEPSAAMAAMSLTLLYAAAFGLVLVASDGAPTLRRLLELSLGLAVVVAVSSWASACCPTCCRVRERRAARHADQLLEHPRAAVRLRHRAGHRHRRRRDPGPVTRALCAAPIPLFALGILFTQSRGAAAGGGGRRRPAGRVRPGAPPTVWAAVVAGLVSVPLMAYANDQPSLRAENVLTEPHAAAGARVAVALLVGAAICAAASLYVRPLASALADRRRSLIAGGELAGGAVLVLVGAPVVRPPEGGPISWADRQFEAFQLRPGARDGATAWPTASSWPRARAGGRTGGSPHEFTECPMAGTGAGDYRFRWAQTATSTSACATRTPSTSRSSASRA